MSKQRINNEQMAQWQHAAQVEITRVTMINENLLSLVVLMLRQFGVGELNQFGGAPCIKLSKKAVQEVDTQVYGVETKFTEDSDDLYIILGSNGPKVQAQRAAEAVAVKPRMCNCYEGEDCESVPIPARPDSEGCTHYLGCIYWQGSNVRPIKGPAQPTAMVCRWHNRVGALGAYCPECNEERASRIVCRNVLAYKRDDGMVVGTIEQAGAGNSGYHMVQCGHTAKQHLHGVGMCKVGDCDCQAFLCAHNERMPHDDGSITCMNPDCDWVMTKEQVLTAAQRGGPQPVQKSIAELDVDDVDEQSAAEKYYEFEPNQ